MGRAIGIDLGTTYSAVAVLQPTGLPAILPNAEGAQTTPSVVLFENAGGQDAPVVGARAKRQAGVRPDDVVQHVKRSMGDAGWRFDSSNDTEYRPEEVSAVILRALVRDAETALGEPIEDVVITVPAYFDDSRRTATRQAGAIAGLNVLRVLNEPTAAALAHGLSADEDGTVLVYDLGGGTFDVSILSIEGRSFEVVATDGDRNLGGFDWDNAIMQMVATALEAEHGVTDLFDDVHATALLREQSEQAKRSLSDHDRTSIHVSHGGAHLSVEIAREAFEVATRSLLRRTQELVEDTLDAAGLDWADIDDVLLVGGSTRMPAVRSMLERLSGKPAAAGVDPDAAVALGAAVQAGIERGGQHAGDESAIVVQDVTSHALGTPALDDHDELRNVVVIAKNERVPAEGTTYLRTRTARTRLVIEVTQGDDQDLDFVTSVGQGVIELDEEWPAETPFAVVYRYDIDQTVTVEVRTDPDDELVGTFEIDRIANMSDQAVEAAAVKVDALTASWVPSASAAQARPSAVVLSTTPTTTLMEAAAAVSTERASANPTTAGPAASKQ